MRLLNAKECAVVTGIGSKAITSTETNNPNWKCECYCYNPLEEKFIDEADDNWLWWVISRPFLMIADALYWVFK